MTRIGAVNQRTEWVAPMKFDPPRVEGNPDPAGISTTRPDSPRLRALLEPRARAEVDGLHTGIARVDFATVSPDQPP